MRGFSFLLAVCFVTKSLGHAQAADVCEAKALLAVPAVEDPSFILKPGEIDRAVTQYRVNKKTGNGVFCSHGGLCYPAHIIVNGREVEALRLTNCKIGARDPYEDPDDVFYSLDVIRSAVPPVRLKMDDVDNRLLEMGLCSACAGNAAYIYLTKPKSKCGRLVREALEGNQDALATPTGSHENACPY